MSDTLLTQLARAAGINIEWTDAFEQEQQVSVEVQRNLLEALGHATGDDAQIRQSLAHLEDQQSGKELAPLMTLEAGQNLSLTPHFGPGTAFRLTLENGESREGKLDASGALPAIADWGYHQLEISDERIILATAPPACPSIDELTGETNAHLWGLTAQLYSLRREGDGGLGDTAALSDLAKSAAAAGADTLAMSPVHAMFSADTGNYSPYSPSSRMFFNILHSAPASVLGEQAVAQAIAEYDLAAEMQRLEALDLIDWPAASQVRLTLLRQLYRNFTGTQSELHEDLTRFEDQGGEALAQHCRFEALHGYMLASGQPGDWRQWSPAFRDPHSAEVERFASEHAGEVGFHVFAQWLIDRSLRSAQKSACNAGMRLGLIADLAVGAHGSGSQTWTRQAEFLPSVSVGAPPDILNRSGQNWGISAFSPSGLRANGFRAFIEMLQTNLAHAGGIRIDHVMGLKRLWIVPHGASPDQGAYLDYPFQDQLRLIALEAWRHRALVIGEDLGTVPPGLREELASRNILGMRVLLFEQDEGRFIPPGKWPRDALATTTTHDLPSLCGWSKGRDIDWRLEAGHSSAEQTEADRPEREKEKRALTAALTKAGCLDVTEAGLSKKLEASIEFIGSTPASLALLPIEDAMASEEQPNLPGPGNEHPNWRRRWPMAARLMLEDKQVKGRLQRLATARASAQSRSSKP
ncbi:4-alpha-glucanotransferase [Pseudomonas profundi]|uniref:4-alpha-glucanotransferase n=1 Tax=Pseudomonas profundi TaxID=1981513 RepID=UPI001239E6F7|nr:4-alpha-glucanotransferase [Pseudomonas profundi]